MTGDIVTKIMAYEEGEMAEGEVIEFFQELVDTRVINSLQGSYQRQANYLAEQGLITLKRG